MGRRNKLLKYIDKKSKGVEIGPACFPLCPKCDGWNVYTVDYATKAELVERYASLKRAGANLDLDRIEEVDFVWNGGSLSELLINGGIDQVDFILASHVIEHVPCLISFLQSASELLKEGGKISLAIPDKRCEFDFLKPLSTTADVVQAYLQKRTRHTAQTAFMAYFNECKNLSGSELRGRYHIDEIGLKHHFDEARNLFHNFVASESFTYSDFHAWFFTPASFELILLELNGLSYIDLELIEISKTRRFEFFVNLKKGPLPGKPGPESFAQRRWELVRRVYAEDHQLPWRWLARTAARRIRALFRVRPRTPDNG